MNKKQETKFTCGLELHQQLNTKKKLFCSCENSMENKTPKFQIERFLRPVTSELGEEDRVALFEFLKKKKFFYNIYKNTCLVEADCEPPHELNKEALNTALEIALLLNCETPDEVQVMRKTVLDGSNTSGFQRTAIVGMNGYINTSFGTVRIKDIELEEEAAALNKKAENFTVYDLNRLGIPLVEISTETDIKSKEHAKEVALKIGMLLRSTGKVKRGLGTIRQDVNISIKNGARVEIKGFQDVRNIDKLIEYEIKRQKALLEIKEELNKKELFNFKPTILDATDLFKKSKNKLIKRILEKGGKVFSLKIPKFSGLMKKVICADKTLGKELVEYVKVYGIGGFIHSDENLKRYGLEEDFKLLEERLNKKKEDVVLIVAGKAPQAKKAVNFLSKRIELLPKMIPEETRSPNIDYTTSYSRPLPGKTRMYPETDILPILIPKKLLNKIKNNLPETLEEKEKRYAKMIGNELASQIVHSKYTELFETCIKEFKVDKKTVATTFTGVLKNIGREGYDLSKLKEKHFKEVFFQLEKNKIVKSSIETILKELCKNPTRSVQEIIKEENLFRIGDKELEEIVSAIIKENKNLIEEKSPYMKKILIKEIMKKVGRRAEGSKISKLLDKKLNRKK